jgi:hypothetical protein
MTASQVLHKAGVRSTHFYAASLGSMGLCVAVDPGQRLARGWLHPGN